MLIDNGAYTAGISNTRSFTYLPEASFPEPHILRFLRSLPALLISQTALKNIP